MNHVMENIEDKGGQPEPAGTSVLFVDDEENILSALKRLFRPAGYKIFVANGGTNGLQVLQQHPIDLVISDMRMPEMDGAEFLSRVAEQWPGTVRILLTGYADLTSTIKAINSGQIYRYISKPWEDNDIKLVIRQALEHKFLEEERRRLLALTRKQNEELTELNANLETKVMQRTEEVRQTMSLLEDAHQDLQRNYDTTIRIFSNLVELREGSMAGHSHRVAEMAERLAIQLGVGEDDKKIIVNAGLLHDIGKIGLPDDLINTPYRSLKPQDQQKVMEHSVIGQTTLMALEPLQEASHLIRSHHERYNGQGYPDRLSGTDIPFGARILAVVNDYDALTSGTLEATAFSEEQAMNYIQEHKGKHYDPAVVDAFVAVLRESGGLADNVRVITVTTKELEPGMVVAKDILTDSGLLLLPKGYVLTEKVIDRVGLLEERINTAFTFAIQKTPA